MSEFIERSKDAWGTSAITDHFAGKNQGRAPGTDSALTRAAGGTSAWNNSPGDATFNAPGQSLPMGSGTNYVPKADVGHRTTQDPFSLADGFPGN